MVPDGAVSCPDCGAPIESDAAGIDGSDAAIYPELARANLLRMRGEYQQAKDVCLSILRRFPNNATANTLIGDICAERGDLEQAAEWYELALDIVPDSDHDKDKLSQVRARLKEREAASTAAQLGLPTSKPKVGLYAAGLVAMVAIVAFASFLIGQQQVKGKSPNAKTGIVNMPISVGESTGERTEPGTGAQETGATATQAPASDGALLSAIATKLNEGSRIVHAWKDPRTAQVFLTLNLIDGDDERAVSARIARAALEHVTDAPGVTLRALKQGADFYVADATRSNFVAVSSDEWKRTNGDDALNLAKALLSSEWYRDRGMVQTPSTSSGSSAESPDTPVSNDSSPQQPNDSDPAQPTADGGAPNPSGNL